MAAQDAAARLDPITRNEPSFDVGEAYEVLGLIEQRRRAAGWQPVGRKIGFTNRTLWPRYGVFQPMWAHVWRHTVHEFSGGRGTLSLQGLVQPRIEPEVAFKLRAVPALEAAASSHSHGRRVPSPETGSRVLPPEDARQGLSPEDARQGLSPEDARQGLSPEEARCVLSAVEWMAPSFEVVQSHFPDWRFKAADCTADCGLHGCLAVGPPVPVTPHDVEELAGLLARFTLTLRKGGEVVERGGGANVLGSPALALAHLVRLLASQPQFPPLAAGEIITTGTLTDAWPVTAGETWSSDYGGLGLAGLTVSFQ